MNRPRLTMAQRSMLSNAINGRALTHGLSNMGRHGASGSATAQALRFRGLIDAANAPTDAGRAVFAPLPTSSTAAQGQTA